MKRKQGSLNNRKREEIRQKVHTSMLSGVLLHRHCACSLCVLCSSYYLQCMPCSTVWRNCVILMKCIWQFILMIIVACKGTLMPFMNGLMLYVVRLALNLSSCYSFVQLQGSNILQQVNNYPYLHSIVVRSKYSGLILLNIYLYIPGTCIHYFVRKDV